MTQYEVKWTDHHGEHGSITHNGEQVGFAHVKLDGVHVSIDYRGRSRFGTFDCTSDALRSTDEFIQTIDRWEQRTSNPGIVKTSVNLTVWIVEYDDGDGPQLEGIFDSKENAIEAFGNSLDDSSRYLTERPMNTTDSDWRNPPASGCPVCNPERNSFHD